MINVSIQLYDNEIFKIYELKYELNKNIPGVNIRLNYDGSTQWISFVNFSHGS